MQTQKESTRSILLDVAQRAVGAAHAVDDCRGKDLPEILDLRVQSWQALQPELGALPDRRAYLLGYDDAVEEIAWRLKSSEIS